MTRSQILTALQRKGEAETARAKALSSATTRQLHNYGMGLIGDGRYDEAIEVFKLNIQRYPNTSLPTLKVLELPRRMAILARPSNRSTQPWRSRLRPQKPICKIFFVDCKTKKTLTSKEFRGQLS
jgi:hypothetical protein